MASTRRFSDFTDYILNETLIIADPTSSGLNY